VRGRQRESRFCRTETAARWTKKAARIIQQVTLQDRPRQGSQTAFSVATRCTSVRRCLIRALIKSRERERERERERGSRFALARPRLGQNKSKTGERDASRKPEKGERWRERKEILVPRPTWSHKLFARWRGSVATESRYESR